MDKNKCIFKICESNGDSLSRDGANLVRGNADRFFDRGVRAFDKTGSMFKSISPITDEFVSFVDSRYGDVIIYAITYSDSKPGEFVASTYRGGALESSHQGTGDACAFARKMDGRSCSKIGNMFGALAR